MFIEKLTKKILVLLLSIFSSSISLAQITNSLHQFIEIQGEQFHFTEEGFGDEIILCLPGFALSSLSFQEFKNYVDLSKFKILALDLKGNGFSSQVDSPNYSPIKQAEIVESFLTTKKLDRVHLVGHSYGGIVSIYLNYLQSKECLGFRIVTTTVIDTPSHNKHIPLFMKLLSKKVSALLLLKVTPLYFRTRIALHGGFYNYNYGKKHFLTLYDKILGQKEYHRSLHKVAKEAMIPNLDDIVNSYQNFKVPFLILWGSNDRFINIKHANKLDQSIPQSSLEIINNTAHNPHEEKPNVVYPLIMDWIQSCTIHE